MSLFGDEDVLPKKKLPVPKKQTEKKPRAKSTKSLGETSGKSVSGSMIDVSGFVNPHRKSNSARFDQTDLKVSKKEEVGVINPPINYLGDDNGEVQDR